MTKFQLIVRTKEDIIGFFTDTVRLRKLRVCVTGFGTIPERDGLWEVTVHADWDLAEFVVKARDLLSLFGYEILSVKKTETG